MNQVAANNLANWARQTIVLAMQLRAAANKKSIVTRTDFEPIFEAAERFEPWGDVGRISGMAKEQPVAEFGIGESVRVIVNKRNRTPHSGVVGNAIWHVKDERWYFFLEENGKRVSKRYAAEDLERI